MRISQFAILSVAMILVGCSSSPVITITNRSTNALTNVVVSGSQFSNRIDTIEVDGRKKITLHPRGESGLRIAFEAGGRHIDADDLAYFESGGGYRIAVVVEPDLEVSATSTFRGF